MEPQLGWVIFRTSDGHYHARGTYKLAFDGPDGLALLVQSYRLLTPDLVGDPVFVGGGRTRSQAIASFRRTEPRRIR